jgi:ABC-type branched-subunit amino acid transport system ATPase component
MEILSVDGLHAAYGRIPVLHGIDLSIEEGEFTGVLGHNGMGKTTLLKTLIGVLTPTAGTIKFRGTDVTRKPAHQRNLAGLGYVAQGRDIFPKLSVLENLRVGLVQHTRPAEERARIEAVLEDFPRLRPLLGRLGGVLSGGEQQILALARCLVGNPRLVMLDEPTEVSSPPSSMRSLMCSRRCVCDAA